MEVTKYHILSAFIVCKLLATSFTLYIFDQYSPLVDSKLYQQELYFENTTAFRTLFIQYIASITNFLTSPVISHYIFSIFSSLGILWYVATSNVRWHILLILLLPSSMIWTSVIGKEAIFYLCFSLLIINWNIYLTRYLKITNWLIIFSSFAICLILRPHYTVCLLWLFLGVYVIKNFKNYKVILFIFYTLVISILLLIIFFGNYIDNYFSTELFDIRWKAFTSINMEGRASRFFSLGFGDILKQVEISNGQIINLPEEKTREIIMEKFDSYFFTGLFFGIIGPFINEIIERIEFIPFFIEGIIILFLPLAFLIYLKFNHSISNKNIYYINYIYGVLPTILLLMITHAFFGILNPGTAIRWRVNFELIFYFTPLIVYFNLKSSKNEKNYSLSS